MVRAAWGPAILRVAGDAQVSKRSVSPRSSDHPASRLSSARDGHHEGAMESGDAV